MPGSGGLAADKSRAECRRRTNESGFTLVELLISASIFAVVLTAVLALLDSANHTAYSDQERNTALNEETLGLKRMVSDLSQAYKVNGPASIPAGGGSSYIDVDVRLVEGGAQVDRRVAYICSDQNAATGLYQCDRYEDSPTDFSWPPPGATEPPPPVTATLVVPRVLNQTAADPNDPVFHNLANADGTGTGNRPSFGLITVKTPAAGERYGGSGNPAQNTVLNESFYMRQLDFGH